MSFQHEVEEYEIQEKTAKALISKGYDLEEIAENTGLGESQVTEIQEEYTSNIEDYELDEHQQGRLEIASQAGLVLDQASEFAGVSEDVALDYMAANYEVKLTEGEKGRNEFTDEGRRIALEGFYDEWKNPSEIMEKVQEESSGDYATGAKVIRDFLDQTFQESPRPAQIEAEEKRLAEAREEDETRIRAFKPIAHKDSRDYKSMTEDELDQAVIEAVRGENPEMNEARNEFNDPGRYEVLDEIEDREIVRWLSDKGMTESEILTTMFGDFDRTEIQEDEIETYTEDGELSEEAKELLEVKEERGDFKFI